MSCPDVISSRQCSGEACCAAAEDSAEEKDVEMGRLERWLESSANEPESGLEEPFGEDEEIPGVRL